MTTDISEFVIMPNNWPVDAKTRADRSNPMATETIEAVYEHGGFRPLTRVDMNLAEGQKVRLMVESIEKPDDILALAAQVYEDLSDDEIDFIEQHTRRRDDFFGERTSS
jgi:predicted DNA-binding antitoxin AbrB/MazE fold protein